MNISYRSYLDRSIQSLMKDIEIVSQEFGSITKEQRKNYSLEKDRKLLVSKRVSVLLIIFIHSTSTCINI